MAAAVKSAAPPQAAPPQASLAPCEYKTGKTLGHGSYATVKEAVQIKTGKRFAVKVISKQLMRGKEAMILNEIEVLKKVSKGHSNIVTLWDYFETPNNLYLVMDLCTGGELFDRICEKGSYYESDAADIVRVVVSAIEYLHSQNIVHRDIKAENLLFKSRESSDPSDLVIADFGLSKMMDEEKAYMLMTTCGTPGYMAPEVIKRTGHNKPVDMWSLGVLTYFLLCGYTPFDANSQAEEIQNILKGKYAFEPKEYWEDVSEEAKDFIRNLLVVNPSKRLTPEQALAHPWLNRPPEPPEGTVPTLEDYMMEVAGSVPDVAASLSGMSPAAMMAAAASSYVAPPQLPSAASASAGDAGPAAPVPPPAASLPPAPVPQPIPSPSPAGPSTAETSPSSGIAIPGRKSGNTTPALNMLGASAPPDVIYAMMNSLMSRPNGLPIASYGAETGSLPGVGLLSRSVATGSSPREKPNLINHVRYNFNARRTFRKAVETVKVVNRFQGPSDSPTRGTASKPASSADFLRSRDNSDDSTTISSGRPASPAFGVLPKTKTSSDSDRTSRDASADGHDLVKTKSDGTLMASENGDSMDVS